jgi:hypothetical protein
MKPYLHWLFGHVYHWLLAALILFQCFLICVLLFGDIGFDHPGKYGLDIEDYYRILGAYYIAWANGVGLAVALKEWRLLELQLAIPFVTGIGVRLHEAWRSRPIDAGDYQHLIGITTAEVRAELGNRSCYYSHTGGKDHEWYNGMELIYNRGRVEVVEEGRPFPKRK